MYVHVQKQTIHRATEQQHVHVHVHQLDRLNTTMTRQQLKLDLKLLHPISPTHYVFTQTVQGKGQSLKSRVLTGRRLLG